MADYNTPAGLAANKLGLDTNTPPFAAVAFTLMNPVSGATGMKISTTGVTTATVGGVVIQAASKSAAVTLNKPSGVITMNGAALAAAAEVTFTVINSGATALSVPIVALASGGTSGAYLISVNACAAGSFDITVGNASVGSLSESLVLNFILFNAANA